MSDSLHLTSLRPGASMPSAVRLVVFDFDGVMTDNTVLVHQDGSELVVCSRGDGMGIGLLRAAGIGCVVLSKEQNPVVAARCRKLGIPYRQGVDDKLPALKAWAAELGFSSAQLAYVGNDVNDVECMGWVGAAICVADAEPVCRAAAHFETRRPGGRGAVRDVCEWLLAARKLQA